MTVRLYYEDSYLTEFTSTVLEQHALGDRRADSLDRTAFYPTSGGQPHDTGTLGGARVTDVAEDSSGGILHFVDAPVEQGPVAGRIDWDRRFDHMQQHTGQHILSQAFVQTAKASTVSFHLGKETSTIDVELSSPEPQLMTETEELASQIVFEDRPVITLTVDREDLGALGVRKESTREGPIRVIEIEGFDRSPCGGTHVRRTGAIGMISILGWERYKGGTRVEFVCGRRALRVLRTDHELLMDLGKTFSAHPGDLKRLSEKLLHERAAQERENARLQDQLIDLEAQELVNRADKNQRAIIVCANFPGRNLDGIKVLAQKVATRPRAIAILAAAQERAQLVVARNSEAAGDCGAAIKQVAARLGGRGGGKPEIAQAGGISLEELNSWFRELEVYFADVNQIAS
jgi:alanyl-tRNA synthetase